jgi:hypothetical protein
MDEPQFDDVTFSAKDFISGLLLIDQVSMLECLTLNPQTSIEICNQVAEILPRDQEINGQTHEQINRQTDRKTDRETDQHIELKPNR